MQVGRIINHKADELPSAVVRLNAGAHPRLAQAGYLIHSTSCLREALAVACFMGISETSSRLVVSAIYLYVNEIGRKFYCEIGRTGVRRRVARVRIEIALVHMIRRTGAMWTTHPP